MVRDYSSIIEPASKLARFTGYLAPGEKKIYQQVHAEFQRETNNFIYHALADENHPEQIKAWIMEDFDHLVRASPEWRDTYILVRDELLARLDEEARKRPLKRALVWYSPIIMLFVILTVYFSVAILSSVDTDSPISSQTGIKQRATAYLKVTNYEDKRLEWPNRRRFLLAIWNWPVSPSQSERAGAREFVGLVSSDYREFARKNPQCESLYTHLPGYDNGVEGVSLDPFQLNTGDRHKIMLERVAEQLLDNRLNWLSPPSRTVTHQVQLLHPCWGNQQPTRVLGDLIGADE